MRAIAAVIGIDTQLVETVDECQDECQVDSYHGDILGAW